MNDLYATFCPCFMHNVFFYRPTLHMCSAVQFFLASVYDVGTYAIAYVVSCYVLCLSENYKIFFEIEKYCFHPVVLSLV